MDAAIECTDPQTALPIAGNGIHETVALLVMLHLQVIDEPSPLPCFRVQTDHAVITADTETVVAALEQRMDMVAHLCLVRIEHLLQPSVTVHQQQPFLPGADPDLSVAGLQHPKATVVTVIVDIYRFKPVVQTV